MFDKFEGSIESQKETITFDPALGWSIDTRNKVKNLVRSYYSFYKLGEPKIEFKALIDSQNEMRGDGSIVSTLAHTEWNIIECSSQLKLFNSQFESTIMHELWHTISWTKSVQLNPKVLIYNGMAVDTLKEVKWFDIKVWSILWSEKSYIVAIEEWVNEFLASYYAFVHKKEYRPSNDLKYFYRGNVVRQLCDRSWFDLQKLFTFKRSWDIYWFLTYVFDKKITHENIEMVIVPIVQREPIISQWYFDPEWVKKLAKDVVQQIKNNQNIK